MSDKTEFNLPGSGYDVITKILHAYVVCGDGKTSLGEVASKSGLDKTMVSRNNAFLISIGVLESGRDKALTVPGKSLAIAIGNSIVEDIRRGWREILLDCPATKAVVDMVNIQKGVAKNDMPGRVASTLGVVAAKASKTGVNTLIEIFEKGELIELADGKYKVVQGSLKDSQQAMQKDIEQSIDNDTVQTAQTMAPPMKGEAASVNPSVHIDLQIHISPESTPEQIEKIFQSIAKHLYKNK